MSDTVKNNIQAFAERFLNLEKQKEDLKADVKALKDEFNQEGVPTSVVIQCINQIKRNKKKTDSEIFEEDSIREWLLQDKNINDSISDLLSN